MKKNEFDYLSLYKIYLDSIEKVSDRRAQINRFYILLHSGLLAILSTIITIISNKDLNTVVLPATQLYLLTKVMIISVTILSIFFCILWFITLSSYKQLNGGKFRVLFKIEDKMPFPSFKEEWEVELGKSRNYTLEILKIKSINEMPLCGENKIIIAHEQDKNMFFIRFFSFRGEILKYQNLDYLPITKGKDKGYKQLLKYINHEDRSIKNQDRIIAYLLSEINKTKNYIEFTKVEKLLPVLIGTVYLTLATVTFILFF
ncbi:MAG: hypothetical protein JXB88_19715 [Spirochaetales bacterium]|nr:hypothetical protein [Spirochaetales bacterium]